MVLNVLAQSSEDIDDVQVLLMEKLSHRIVKLFVKFYSSVTAENSNQVFQIVFSSSSL